MVFFTLLVSFPDNDFFLRYLWISEIWVFQELGERVRTSANLHNKVFKALYFIYNLTFKTSVYYYRHKNWKNNLLFYWGRGEGGGQHLSSFIWSHFRKLVLKSYLQRIFSYMLSFTKILKCLWWILETYWYPETKTKTRYHLLIVTELSKG